MFHTEGQETLSNFAKNIGRGSGVQISFIPLKTSAHSGNLNNSLPRRKLHRIWQMCECNHICVIQRSDFLSHVDIKFPILIRKCPQNLPRPAVCQEQFSFLLSKLCKNIVGWMRSGRELPLGDILWLGGRWWEFSTGALPSCRAAGLTLGPHLYSAWTGRGWDYIASSYHHHSIPDKFVLSS